MTEHYLDKLLTKHGHHVFDGWTAPKRATYIGRGSLYGNPFRLKDKYDDEERYKVIDEYRLYLADQIEEDPAFAGAVKSLRNQDLKCYCSNGKNSKAEGAEICHGLVLLHAAELLNIYISTKDTCKRLREVCTNEVD